MKPESILEKMFYGSKRAVDTPLAIGNSLAQHRDGEYYIPRTRDLMPPTIYYKVKQVCVHKCGAVGKPESGYVYDSWRCLECHFGATKAIAVKGDEFTITEYVYFYHYYPVDTKAPHEHDWTGGMVEVVDGVPKRLVCRSHWDFNIYDIAPGFTPCVFVSNGDHSLSGGQRLSHDFAPLVPINPIYKEITDNDLAQIEQIYRDTSGAVTPSRMWGDRQLTKWARWPTTRRRYKKMLWEAGHRRRWWQSPPRPDQIFELDPALFLAMKERVDK